MKCISLYNPHALMLSLSIKKTETRKRRTHYRGPLAIHATQTTPRAWFEKSLEIPAVKDVLRGNAMGGIGAVAWIATRGQGGLVVATCELVDCVEITADNAPWEDDADRSLGDWTPGRFAWKLARIKRLDPGFVAKGKQGMWDWPAPTLEIVGPDGSVHYRRPFDHADVDEARRTPGYTVRLAAEVTT